MVFNHFNTFSTFSTVFQLYRLSQCPYPCFRGVLLTSTQHNIPSKPLAAFPHNHSQNNGQWCREWLLSQWLSSILGRNIGRARDPNHSQEHSLFFFSKILLSWKCNSITDWLNCNYGLANQKLCYFQLLLNIENLDNKTKNVLRIVDECKPLLWNSLP